MSSNSRFDGFNPEPAPFDRDPEPQPMPQPQPQPQLQTHQQDYETRVERARLAVVAMGIDWPKTIVPEGSALISVGTDKLKRDRSAWDRMPLLADALPAVRAALESEQRKDYEQKVSAIRIRPADGRIVRFENISSNPTQVPGLAYTDHALRQIMSQAGMLDSAPRGFAQALAYITNEERAQVFNRLVVGAEPDKLTILRTKVPHTGTARVVRAALSERYGDADDPTIAGIIGRMNAPAGAKLSYMPGDTASRFEIVFPSKVEIPNFRAGDIHYASVHARSSETGQGAFDSFSAFVRAICVNLTTAERHGVVESVRHIGTDASVQAKVSRSLRRAVEELEPLLETIGYAAALGLDQWTVEKALGRIALKYGEGPTAAQAWEAQFKQSQYPDTVWGLTAAITEAAHGRESWVREEDWEGVASAVMADAVQSVKQGYSWAKTLDEGGEQMRDMRRRALAARAARAN